MGVASLVEVLFRGAKFKSLEGISLGGSCRLRRIFTLQATPTSSEEGISIPHAFHITSVVIKMQVCIVETTIHVYVRLFHRL